MDWARRLERGGKKIWGRWGLEQGSENSFDEEIGPRQKSPNWGGTRGSEGEKKDTTRNRFNEEQKDRVMEKVGNFVAKSGKLAKRFPNNREGFNAAPAPRVCYLTRRHPGSLEKKMEKLERRRKSCSTKGTRKTRIGILSETRFEIDETTKKEKTCFRRRPLVDNKKKKKRGEVRRNSLDNRGKRCETWLKSKAAPG